MRAQIVVLILSLSAGITSPIEAQGTAASDVGSARKRLNLAAMHQLFTEATLTENALEVCQRAARLSPDEGYQRLSRWVLPNQEHPTFRLIGDYYSSNPAPPVNFQNRKALPKKTASPVIRYLEGKQALAIPAMDLIDAARSSDRLHELRGQVNSTVPSDPEEQRSKLALLFLIDVAREDYSVAEQIFEQFVALDRVASRKDLAVRWRDVLIMWSTFSDDRARKFIGDYFFSHYGDLSHYYPDQRYDILTDYARVLHGIYTQMESADHSSEIVSESAGGTPEAVPFSYDAASLNGSGRPNPLWAVRQGEAWKFAGHEVDYLSYRIPLRGNYVVECDATTGSSMHSSFMTAGKRVEYIGHNNTLGLGSFRFDGEHPTIAPPVITIQGWVRHRAVVEDGILTHFINGLKVHEQPLTPHFEPWVATCSWRRSQGGIRNLRIFGQPEIPDELHLTGDPDLAGWVPYYETGFSANRGFWSVIKEPSGGYGLSGYYRENLAGSGMEKLIRYIRPMVEGGTVEYDFFYRRGQSEVHPAIDRLAFLLEPGGVRIHWITDGNHDRSGLDPWNTTLEPENRRGPETLPLIENQWNRIALNLENDNVQLSLNGQLIYERKLEPENRRTFGLFHYCGETKVHARNIVWRGNWPKTLPPVEDRQFTKSITPELDAVRDALPAVFRHDFSQGLPPELFDVEGDETHLKLIDRGVYVERAADAGIHALRSCLQVGGDFDIVLTFEDLKIDQPVFLDRAGIGIATWLDNPQEDKAKLFRRNGRSAADQRAEFEHLFIKPNGKFHYNGGRHIGEAADRGRLRLARRGNVFYSLCSEFDSPDYRIIAEHTVSDKDLTPQGIQLITDCANYLSVSAVFTSLEIRAERIYGLPVEDWKPIVERLEQNRDQFLTKKIDFTRAESYTGQFLPIGQVDHVREFTDEGMHLKAASDGDSRRVQYYSEGISAPLCDVDAELAVKELNIPPVLAAHNEIVLEAMFQPNPENPLSPFEAALILRQKANGVRYLIARVYRPRRGNAIFYLPIRAVPVKSPDRLRIATRDKTVYFLYSETDSDELQVLAEYTIDTELSIRTVLLNAIANGQDSVADVTWKSVTIQEKKSETLPVTPEPE